MCLKGKVMIITGSGRGIGKACAIDAASEGAKVVIAEISEEMGSSVVNEIKEIGGEADFVQTDVSNLVELSAAIKFAAERYGRLDIILSNAAIVINKLAHEHTEADWESLMAVNAKSYFFGAIYAIEQFRKQGGGGVILNTASIDALQGDYALSLYSMAKGAIAQLTRCIAVEYARENIRVLSVSPGVTRTEMQMAVINESADPERRLKERNVRIPAGRMVEPYEIAKVVSFLASDAASGMTGTMVAVDLGLSSSWDFPSEATKT
ncbi:uncharacterized oxidoreductase TM_0325-like [Aplysia californica]|uniref:Uncharacterized oxidoreductase TM_0325-like n=1 Tax=Aplysia californica TaxID=6500 RepID=A0ABM1W4N9_APLCA|nr:uncharacterized oxidoreductase TM_0325-like [Aplysia californica]